MAEWLPHLLFDLRADLGEAAMLRLVGHAGGRRLWVPASVAADHALAIGAGLDVASWLVERYPGEHVLVPAGPRSTHNARVRLIRGLLTQDAATAEIVRQAGCHERTVYRHKAALREADDRQGDLFAPRLEKGR